MTCLVISFRKAENWSFSCTKFCLTASFLFSTSTCSRLDFAIPPFPPFSPPDVTSTWVESTSNDLALRTLPTPSAAPPCPCLFFRMPLLGSRMEDGAFFGLSESRRISV